ncbi:MAG: GDSL-type esterase/lipase family protein [Daejeonella sp.]|uniref:GDSL-type esterase/lipase family protein n=1 Tax=Daejeonella sp. JGW-45 TaxID=3034148 RepID=UPI0023ED513D|nr:GDSL-type esterase/lipase family protein [Daejeonella sp. JGW-45]
MFHPAKLFLSLALLFVCSGALAQAPLKVACIGNSVTFGAGLKDPSRDSYPSVLQTLLGNRYQVSNFGRSGATLLKKGHRPYFKTPEFEAALDLKPDIAIIHLGLNDTDPRNWPEYKDEFEADYSWLLDTLKKENPKVKLFVSRLTPIFSGHPRFRSGTRDWYWQIQELIPGIAKANRAQLIDLNKPLHNRPDLFADNVHPDKEGAAIIARTVYQALTGDFGGLQLARIFGDHMVLQRNEGIPVYGTANAGDKVKVSFADKTLTTLAGSNGNWQVIFPPMTAGGPHTLKVSTSVQNVAVSDILLGDVWLCSGQSNMAFELKNSADAARELPQASNNNLRLLKLHSLRETHNTEWDSTTLAKINQLQYFAGNWQSSDPSAAGGFSAIAYHFGKQIQQSENVPVGLIEIAVGGSGIESWIDRKTLEHNEKLVDLLSGWRKSDFIMPWVRERADKNLKNSGLVNQRHPYEPAYNYEAGISHFTRSPIKGVIWYQGESNAHNAELYETQFKALVESWRGSWNQEFPFYYVQLSSIARPSWPHFRNMQRELQSQIPNVGMVVSSDMGDSLDVHPIRKKEIGQRLALLALKNTYHRPVTASGPVATSAVKKNNEIVVAFSEARDLSASGNQTLTGFELLTEKGISVPVPARINGKHVYLRIPEGGAKSVRYAWQPFSRANLVNEAGLPASTFSIPIN